MKSIYKIALSTLLLIGITGNSHLNKATASEIASTDSQQVALLTAKNKQKPCPKTPKTKPVSHRGSGRVEPEQPVSPVTKSKMNQGLISSSTVTKPQSDSDQPGGDNRRASRGSGRLESQAQTQSNEQQAHRGSGRFEA